MFLGDDESVARDYASYCCTGGKDKWDKTTVSVGSFTEWLWFI